MARKLIVYACIILGILFAMFFVSSARGYCITITWLGALGANSIFLTAVIMLFDTTKSIRASRPKTKYIVYLVTLLMYLALFVIVYLPHLPFL